MHIADVSYFVKENTPLEEEVRLRTTSVYLVHKVITMLPRIFCDNLCSLNPGLERLCFSVFFQMRKDGTVLWDQGLRFHKSVIKSCAKLNYELVQTLLEKNPNID